MSDLAFGLLFGVVFGILVAVLVILWAISIGLNRLQEIRDLLKDGKDD